MADKKTPKGHEVRREVSDAMSLQDSVGIERVSEEELDSIRGRVGPEEKKVPT